MRLKTFDFELDAEELTMTDLSELILETVEEESAMSVEETSVMELFSHEQDTAAELALIPPRTEFDNVDETGDEWATVEQNVEAAIMAMEKAFPHVHLRTRNAVWNSLHRCYQRAKSIRKIRGIEKMEDYSDNARFVDAKCMLGVLI